LGKQIESESGALNISNKPDFNTRKQRESGTLVISTEPDINTSIQRGKALMTDFKLIYSNFHFAGNT